MQRTQRWTTRSARAAIPSRPEPKRATLSRGQTSVLVLNGNGVAGAAAAEASRARARGYRVAGTANAPQTYGRTVVMYRAGRRPEAKRLAADMGVALVGPLDGLSPRQLHGAAARRRPRLVAMSGAWHRNVPAGPVRKRKNGSTI